MNNLPNYDKGRHLGLTTPSPWVTRFAPLAPSDGPVLDLACGSGRHGRLFLARGHAVVFLDRDVADVQDLAGGENVEITEADLENGGDLPFTGRKFAAIVVTNSVAVLSSRSAPCFLATRSRASTPITPKGR